MSSNSSRGPQTRATQQHDNSRRGRAGALTPQSLEAEQSTLGACLIESTAMSYVMEILRPEDFYRELHRKIYRVMLELAAKVEPVDFATVPAELNSLGLLEDCGGADYITALIDACPSSGSVATYAAKVFDLSQKRQFALLASELEVHAMNGKTAGDIRVWLRERLDDFSSRAGAGEQIKEWTAAELMETEFPPARFAVEGLLPNGLTIFAGAPKIGKSWLSYGLALAVSQGGKALGKHDAKMGEALYLALEDVPRRLKERLRVLLKGPDGLVPAPTNLKLATEWPRLDQGGLEKLDSWLAAHPDCRLVVVDTFQKVRPQRNGSNVYEEDYLHFAALKRIADARSVAVVVVLHTAKRDASDVLQTIAGSTGQTGAADAIWVLQRPRNSKEGMLYITGRDVGESEIPLAWTPDLGLYTEVDADEVQSKTLSAERQEILDILGQSQWPIAPREIAELLDKKPGSVRKLLWTMKADGQVRAFEGDKYALADWAKSASVPPVGFSRQATPPPDDKPIPPYPDWLEAEAAKLNEASHTARNFWVFWYQRYTSATLDTAQFAEYFPQWVNDEWPQKPAGKEPAKT